MDPTQVVQAFLFALFAGLTSLLSVVIGPTYDNLLVPELQAGSLYPSLGGGGGSGFLSEATRFSEFLLGTVVDPTLALVALGVAGLYLARSVVGRWTVRFESALPKLIVAVILSNFSLPIAGGILGIAGAAYPVFATFDGGAWQHWMNLAGIGELQFSWDNGALAFVVSFALFSLILLLAAIVAVRDALLAVLLVLLPVFTLFWPIPTLAPLARRAWTMFGQLAFLPCLLVIPLELAVGSPNILLLLGFFVVALSTPSIISLAASHLSNLGFPSGGGALAGGVQRGLSVGSLSVSNLFRPLQGFSGRPSAIRHVARAGQAVGGSAFPAGLPLLGADLLGRGAAHLLQHVARKSPAGSAPAFRPVNRPPRSTP